MIEIKVNGRVLSKEEYAEWCKKRDDLTGGMAAMLKARQPPGGHRPGCWPQKSRSLGVMPEQRSAAYAESVAIGVPTQFDEEGLPEFTDRSHRAKYLKGLGYMDLDAGYGDPNESTIQHKQAETAERAAERKRKNGVV